MPDSYVWFTSSRIRKISNELEKKLNLKAIPKEGDATYKSSDNNALPIYDYQDFYILPNNNIMVRNQYDSDVNTNLKVIILK